MLSERIPLLISLGAWLSAFCALPAERPFIVGVCAHFGQGKGHLPGNLSLMKQAGVVSFRDELAWRSLERARGQLQVPQQFTDFILESVKQGLEPMLILDYGNPFYDKGDKPLSPEAIEGFVRYSEFVVTHFRGKVKHYEVWNEWDIGIGGTTPGTAEDYVRLLAAVYPRIKKVDPSIIVYGGAMTPGGIRNGWMERMLKAGALNSLDQVSIHTYNYSNSGRERTPEAWASWMKDIEALIDKYRGGKKYPLVVTEMGWPTQIDRRGTPPSVSADYLARMYLLGRTIPAMRGIWWYDFQDDGWQASYNENNFGLVRPDLTPKPGYFALADISRVVGTAEFVGRVETSDPEIWVLRFRTADRKGVLAMWSAHEDDGWQITLRNNGNLSPLVVTEVGHGSVTREWGARNWAEARTAAAIPNELQLVVRGTPWVITGDLADVSITEVKRREQPEAMRGGVFLR
ncbi:MAG TPA: hypothetical protein VFL57_10815 [Bryobacteraceae bacterium]|nr:hypothetical protein [Bryobacteraceae bacterium]